MCGAPEEPHDHREYDISTTARSPAGSSPERGTAPGPAPGRSSYLASAHRPNPCAPRFRCSGAARLSCANRAHSVRKRGPTVFLWCGRHWLQAHLAAKAQETAAVVRFITPISGGGTADNRPSLGKSVEEKEDISNVQRGKEWLDICFYGQKGTDCSAVGGQCLGFPPRLLPFSANLRRRDRHQSTEMGAAPF